MTRFDSSWTGWIRSLATAVLGLALAACGSGGNDAPDVAAPTYLKSYGLSGADILQPHLSARADGGQMMAGLVQPRNGSAQPLLARLDAAGNVLWARQIGQIQAGDFPLTTTVVARSGDQGVVWALGSTPTGAAVVRLGANGSVLGVTDLPASIEARDLALLPDGQVLVVGEVPVTAGSRDRRLWTARLASQGQLIATDTPTPLPSDGEGEQVTGVRVDSGGSFIVYGTRDSFFGEYWVASFTAEGSLRWSDTHTDGDGFGDIGGRARAAAFVGRQGGTGVDGARWVTVGEMRNFEGSGFFGTQRRNMDSKLIVLDERSGDERDNRNVDNLNDADDRYFDVTAGPGPNDIRLLGWTGAPPGCEAGTSGACRPSIWLEARRRNGEGYERTARWPLMRNAVFDQAAALGADGSTLVLVNGSDREPPELHKLDPDDPTRVLWRHSLADLSRVLSEARSKANSERERVPVRIVGTAGGGALLVMKQGIVAVSGDGSRLFVQLGPALDGFFDNVIYRPLVQALPGGGSVLIVTDRTRRLLWLRHDDDGRLISARSLEGLSPSAVVTLDVDGDGRRDDRLMVLAQDGATWTLLRMQPDGSVIDRRDLPSSTANIFSEATLVNSAAGSVVLGPGSKGILRLDAAGEPSAQWALDGTELAGQLPGWPGAAALAADGSLHLALERQDGTVRLLSIGPDGTVRLRAAFAEPGRRIGSVGVTALPDGGVALHAGLGDFDFSSTLGRAIDGADAVAWRVETDGRIGWARRYGTARSDLLGGMSVAGRDNGLLALGISSGFTTPSLSVLAGRLDADGSAGASCNAAQPAPRLQVAVDTAAAVGPRLLPAPVLATAPLPTSGPVQVEESALTLQVARACDGIAQSPDLLVEVAGPGQVDSQPAGIACRASRGADCAQAYPTGSSVVLSATPDAGARFVGWEGDCASAGIGTAASLLMDRPRRCMARFQGVTTPPPPPTQVGTCRADAPLVGSWQDAIGAGTPVTDLSYGVDATLRGGQPLVAVSTAQNVPGGAHRPWVAQWTGTTWSRLGSDADPTLPGFAGAPQIRANANAVWLAWAYTDFVSTDGAPPNRLEVRVHDGSGWRALPRPVAQPSGTLVRWWLLLPADGAPVIAWQEPTRQRVQVLRWNGSAWDTLEPLEASRAGGLWALATDAAGTRLGAVWAGTPDAATTELRTWMRNAGGPGAPWVERAAGTLPGPGTGGFMSDLQLVLDGERMDAVLQRSDSSGRSPTGGPFVAGRQATGAGAWVALGDAGALQRPPDFAMRPVGLQLLAGCGGAPWLAWRDDLNYPEARLWTAQAYGGTAAAWQVLGGEVVPQASVGSVMRVLSAGDGSAWAAVVRATPSAAGSSVLRPELRLQRFVPSGP